MSKLFVGHTLVRANGSSVDPATLKSKIVLLYFSAHWCPPCRQFTPMLRDFYEETKSKIEVVFISSDKQESEMLAYMKELHGDWCALDFKDRAFAQSLSQKYQVRGIPALIVVQDDGVVITDSARADVQSTGPRVVDQWKKQWKGDAWGSLGQGQALSGSAAAASQQSQGDAESEREKRLKAIQARMG